MPNHDAVTDWKRCDDCGQRFDHLRQRGACPHGEYEAGITEALIWSRLHPSYHLRHRHVFERQQITHYHSVGRGAEFDEQHHVHNGLVARHGAERMQERERRDA